MPFFSGKILLRLLFFLLLCFPALATEKRLSGKVISVLDGDSLAVLTEARETVRIRLFGIDSPEGGQPFGRASRRLARQLCFGKVVMAQITGVDRYGRMLAIVILPDGTNLNVKMVEQGLAWHYRHYSQDATIAKAEQSARKARRGLWADPSPTPPWEYRQLRRKSSAQ